MRRKNQAERRGQLASAARQVLLERGAVGVRVKDVAERAGMSPSSVLYYYPEIEDLLLEVSRAAIDRFAESRARAVRELDDPLAQLRLAIRLGVPTGPDDDESRLLYELDALTGTSPAFAALTTSYFDRQVGLYESVLSAGAAAGLLSLASGVESVARGLVALEDGLGLQVVIGHPSIDSAEAERILLEYAGAMTATPLAA
ncbi:MAG TPA: TetR family transcriptional regulator C-terminal domain-containing protein [Solirubrobacterales bacterium]|jgi:AcrR family transcriptional regulator